MFCCFKFAWLICYVLWGSLMLILIRMSFCSFFPPIFKTGARKRSSSCQVHGRATGIGGFIHSSYLYRTNTAWKACEWGYGTSNFEVLCDLLSCNYSWSIYLQAVPDDLKTKLSIDEDLVSSPKEALSRSSAERVTIRNKNIKRCDFLAHNNANFTI